MGSGRHGKVLSGEVTQVFLGKICECVIMAGGLEGVSLTLCFCPQLCVLTACGVAGTSLGPCTNGTEP